jgi:hypothetical protein
MQEREKMTTGTGRGIGVSDERLAPRDQNRKGQGEDLQSTVRGPRSDVGDQRSEIQGRRSQVRGPRSQEV